MNRYAVLIAGLALASAPSLRAQPPAASPPAGGTIAIVSKTAAGDYDPSARAFVDAASKAFTAKGFTILNDPAHAAYVAELSSSRADVGTALGKDPQAASIGIGAGLAIPFPTGNSSVFALQRTRLEMRIRKRGETGTVWAGTAVTVRPAGTRAGADDTVASTLSEALLRSYPAQPTDTLGVP